MLTTDPGALRRAAPSGYALTMARMVRRRPQTVCDTSGALWQALSASLVVLIGEEGFNALYDRCLHEASATYSWLKPDLASALSPSRLENLRAALASAQEDDAARATVLQLTCFTDVLSSLIGAHLTDHILRAAWGQDFDHFAPESAA